VSVTRAQVQEIAALARLSPDPEEIERLTVQLAAILEHALELELAGDDETPADNGAGASQLPLRSDEPPADGLAILPSQLAPDWRDGFFIVPRLSAMQPGAAAENAES
jgi:aspartyl/glutamyl-tRNA(Asn/Gln) amidotransferase C subunit